MQCFKDLYVRVAAGDRSSEAFEQQLTERLDELEAAYYRSRNICRLRQQLKLEDGGCGTTSLSPHEFVTISKAIILDEDAGWVKRDPALAEALRLAEGEVSKLVRKPSIADAPRSSPTAGHGTLAIKEALALMERRFEPLDPQTALYAAATLDAL